MGPWKHLRARSEVRGLDDDARFVTDGSGVGRSDVSLLATTEAMLVDLTRIMIRITIFIVN